MTAFEERVFSVLQKYDGYITHDSFALVMKEIYAQLAVNGNLESMWPVILQPKWKPKV